MPEPALTIASLIHTPALAEACGRWLKGGRYQLVMIDPARNPVAALEEQRENCDAVLMERGAIDRGTCQALADRGLLLPAVVIGAVTGRVEVPRRRGAAAGGPAGTAELQRRRGDLAVPAPRTGRRGRHRRRERAEESDDRWKLANRLEGRLGYLGVYYKRDPSRFLRHLPEEERNELLRSLTRTYRDLLISYFRDPAAANQALESYVNTAFFSDLPITNTVKIHMKLIDSFGKQLKLEGHTDDFLQDYRLALLDVMAHLCEMYRRSIPGDAPLKRRTAAVAVQQPSKAADHSILAT